MNRHGFHMQEGSRWGLAPFGGSGRSNATPSYRIGSTRGERLDPSDRVVSVWHVVDLGLDVFGGMPVARTVEHRAHGGAYGVYRQLIPEELQPRARSDNAIGVGCTGRPPAAGPAGEHRRRAPRGLFPIRRG